MAELTEIVRSISRRIAEVGLGDKQAILDQYADILRLRNRLASTAPEDKAWTRDALDVRNRFTFDCAEWDVSTEELIRTHSNAGDNSGGEQEKLMAFCLAGALSFNLASPESADNTPVFAQLMLDEAFSKSDPQFAQQALQAFRKFGFQLVIVATVQNATTIQPYIDSVVMVSKTEPTGRNARPSRLGGDQDDLGVHVAAPGDARGLEEGSCSGVESCSIPIEAKLPRHQHLFPVALASRRRTR